MKAEEQEVMWDGLLKVKTQGRDDSHATQYKYPYEPTPYSVLERLAGSGLIRKKNHVLDYGCGKGRVEFFLSYQTRCQSVGIEYDERIYESAMGNLDTAVSGARVSFIKEDATKYTVPEEMDRFYFFNPFSVEILHTVYAKILDSYYENPREMYLFFYYPSDEYVSFLMTQEELLFDDEIDCRDLFPGNDEREKILIFQVV